MLDLPTTTTVSALESFAAKHGVTVKRHAAGDEKGLFFSDFDLICIRRDLSETDYRCTLAHELGHWWHGHVGCLPGKAELQARFWAAKVLVSPAEYAAAEESVGADVCALAHELQVTTEVVCDWRQWWQSRGRFEYGSLVF